MKARAELEIYRRFAGKLRRRPLRFWPIVASNVRVSCKKKLPLLLLYVPPAIGTIVICFVVYAKFTLEGALEGEGSEEGLPLAEMMALQATKLFEVRNMIAQFMQGISGFALLAVAWYGSGLLCEDRRVGAHQLYFTRPLTRLDYFLGKFLTAATFAGLTVLVPGIVINIVAIVTSPDASFLKEQGDLLPRTILFASIWTVVVCSITLCASSLAPRRVFALVGIFAFFMLSEGIGQILGQVVAERYLALAPLEDLNVVGKAILRHTGETAHIRPSLGWTALAATVALSLVCITRRIRRWEVVG